MTDTENVFFVQGHGWGSHHDPVILKCAPKDIDGGKYIMYNSAVNGLQKNNDVSVSYMITRVNFLAAII